MNLVSRFSCHCPSLAWDLLLIYIYDYFCVHVNTHTQHLCFHHYMIALLPWIPPCTQLCYIPSVCPSPSALCSAGALCSTWLAFQSELVCGLCWSRCCMKLPLSSYDEHSEKELKEEGYVGSWFQRVHPILGLFHCLGRTSWRIKSLASLAIG